MEMYEVLASVRKEKKMSFEELSQQTGLSMSTLKKILTGVTKAPLFENVRSIAYALGLSLNDLDQMIADSNKSARVDVVYISRPSGDPTVDELRKQLHQFIDELDEDALKNFTGLFIKMKE